MLGRHSHFQEEREILTEQDAKETTVIKKMGNILLLETAQVRPVNAVTEDNYLVELALRYAYENFL